MPQLTTAQASPAHPSAQNTQANWVLAAAILASSMAFIDGTAVTVALPAMQAAFHANDNQIQWIVELYALFLASLLLVGGSLGDLYGRRIVFTSGVAIFAAGSIWCALALSISSLIAARGIQGVGAALLVPGSLSLISAAFPEETRGRAIGIWSGFSAMTAAIGPVLGGWLVDHASWRWVFFLNIPLAVAIVIISFLRIPESRNEQDHQKDRRLDWPGALLATLGLAGVTFALIEGRRSGAIIPLVAVFGGLALVALVFVENRRKSPMLPLGLFRSATFTGANLLTLFLYTALNGLLFFFPINLIEVQHYSATEAGAALLPLILLLFLLSHWSGGLIERFGARLPLTIGPVVAAFGFALAARPSVGGSYWTTFFPAVMVIGLGMALTAAPLTTTVMNAAPVDQAGAASGINNAMSRLASLISVALFGIILVTAFRTDLQRRLDALHLPPTQKQAIEAQRSQLAAIQTTDPAVRHAIDEAFVFGFRRILWLAMGLSLASAACAQVLSNKPTGRASP